MPSRPRRAGDAVTDEPRLDAVHCLPVLPQWGVVKDHGDRIGVGVNANETFMRAEVLRASRAAVAVAVLCGFVVQADLAAASDVDIVGGA
ncbi:hypothetical protein ACIF9R_06560 [Streptomyces sp. NPDC086080]|uniref:hypothetical protein n=1 Tax=Streptomyces sp. NPDC086080 TaxID=3365748 RepID=UPI0037CE95B9